MRLFRNMHSLLTKIEENSIDFVILRKNDRILQFDCLFVDVFMNVRLHDENFHAQKNSLRGKTPWAYGFWLLR